MTGNSITDIRDLLDALSENRMSLNEVAQRFREHKWIRAKRSGSQSNMDWLASHLDDAGPPLSGSFDEVSTAFHEHRITRDQYRVLSEAAADAMEAQDAADSE